jgi:hypothetical protein
VIKYYRHLLGRSGSSRARAGKVRTEYRHDFSGLVDGRQCFHKRMQPHGHSNDRALATFLGRWRLPKNQKTYFRANWITRGFTLVEVIWPNDPDARSGRLKMAPWPALGLVNCAWLNMLKNSARN